MADTHQVPVGPRRVKALDGVGNEVMLGKLEYLRLEEAVEDISGQVVLCLGAPDNDYNGWQNALVAGTVKVMSVTGQVGWLYVEELEPEGTP